MKRKGKEIDDKETNNTDEPKFNFGDMKVLQKQISAHVKRCGGTVAVGGQDFVNELVRTTFQALLDAEMEEHLGRGRYERRDEGNERNYRNGGNKKILNGDFGAVEIETPRDRNGTFEPIIIPKRDNNISHRWTDKIISLYSRGMTTTEISEHLKEMYGIEASPAFISNATERVIQDVKNWQQRRLDTVYVILYLDGIRFKVRDGGSVKDKVIYLCIGVNLEGRQDVLGMWVADNEGAKFWLSVCQDLKSRGVDDIIISCVDGLKGFPDAIKAVFPKSDVQLCIVHHIRSVTQFVPYKDRKAFCADMREIYGADTLEQAADRLDEFEKKWGAKYPASIKSWRNNWDLLTTFFRYPKEFRKIIYTTNAIEGLNSQLRKNTSNRKVFPCDDAVFKILYLNIERITKKWTKRSGWYNVMAQLYIMFEDRFINSSIGC